MRAHRRTGLVLGAMVLLGGAVLARPVSPGPQGPPAGRGFGPQAAPSGPQLLHPMFQDHAILQRDIALRVYGETAPGAAVTVTLGTATVQTRAGTDGRWQVTLSPMPAGGPLTLTALANGETKSVTDVLIGDVFFCAGQSNMAFAQRQTDGAAEDARTSTDPQIRELTIGSRASLTPRATFATAVRWISAAPETVGGFSAACYYFARELKKTTHVPIGLVVAAYGGARLRNFMAEDTLRTVGLEDGDLDILDSYRRDPTAGTRAWGARFEAWWKATRPGDGLPWRPDFSDAGWKTAPSALGAWALWNGSNPDGVIGQMWMRSSVTLTAAQASSPSATLDLGSVNQEDWTWINGTFVGASSFSNRTRYAIPAGLLHAGPNMIVTNQRAKAVRQLYRGHTRLLVCPYSTDARGSLVA